jgi:hypothetical protein
MDANNRSRTRDSAFTDLRNISVATLLSNLADSDNPRDYADNEDARKFDPRLRGPVDPVPPCSSSS